MSAMALPLGPDELQAALAALAHDPLLPAYVLGAFIAAGALFVSAWLVIAETVLLFAPAVAIPLALAGALLSALTFYGVGRLAGAAAVQRFAPRRVQEAMSGAGLRGVFLARALPLLPFTFVNLCAGAFEVPLGVFVVGTVLGMAPGVVALALLGERVLAVVRDPSPGAIAWLVAAVVLALVIASAVRRRRRRRPSA
jgi:phospholipase D1/2